MTKGDVSVSAIAVIDLANELIELEVINKLWLKQHCKSVFDLLTSHGEETAWHGLEEKRLTEDLLIKLWQQAENCSSVSNIGIKIGRKVNINAKGVLANWISQCSTFSEAFSVFTDHISLLNPSECWEISEGNDQLAVSFRFEKEGLYPFSALQRSLTAFMAWTEFLLGEELCLIRAEFVIPEPSDIAMYKNIFGNNLSFNAGRNCLYLNKEVLNYPLVHSNQYLKHIMSERAQNVLSQMNKNKSVTLKVKNYLQDNLALYCQQEKLCNALHMSRATLYRKLQAENTSFSELLDEVRAAYNKQLKHKGVSVNEISTLLGYQDVSTYYKKFKND